CVVRVGCFFSSRRRHTRSKRDWSSGVCSSDLIERKLESAKDNLTVFVQRMDEAEKQLRPLEKQAETAKKYRAYSDQLKYEEVNTYLLRCDNFAYETGKHRDRIQKAEARLSAIRRETDTLDEE